MHAFSNLGPPAGVRGVAPADLDTFSESVAHGSSDKRSIMRAIF